jgi:hypothetical protein
MCCSRLTATFPPECFAADQDHQYQQLSTGRARGTLVITRVPAA